VLKPNDLGEANVWKKFSLVFSTASAQDDEIHVKYFCACKKFFKVCNYKASDGSSFGTKNLLDHSKQCRGSDGQMLMPGCLLVYLSSPESEQPGQATLDPGSL